MKEERGRENKNMEGRDEERKINCGGMCTRELLCG
jgi:hypothetical protein